MNIPNRGKLVRYNYDFRGVLSSRNYYNENQSYFLRKYKIVMVSLFVWVYMKIPGNLWKTF